MSPVACFIKPCWPCNALRAVALTLYLSLAGVGPAGAAQPLPIAAAAQVAAGGLHTCVVHSAGAVACLGSNYFGQLGDGSSFDRPNPVAVSGLAAGTAAVAAGAVHSCALSSAGGTRCWGDNTAGQLGDGSTTQRRVPTAVVGLSSGVRAIAAGGFHTCALLMDNSLRCWGDNSFGQLGDGSTLARLQPVAVVGLPEAVTAVAAGGLHTCALGVSGAVWCWGDNRFGQLGDGSLTERTLPVLVLGLGGAVNAVSLGAVHSCARRNGAALCWGGNFLGQLGDGSPIDRPQPTVVSGLSSGVTALAAGGFHSCSLTSSSTVKCWGFNVLGQLGDSSRDDRAAPVDVLGVTGAAALSAGGVHSCALNAGGLVQCWGNFDGSEFAAASALRNAPSLAAATDAAGRYVLFESDASDLLNSVDSNAARDIFRLDRKTGDRLRVSVDDGEAEILGPSIEPAISADGILAVFVAPDSAVRSLRGETATQRKARQKGGGFAVYLRNLLTGSTQRIGQATTTGSGSRPQIAADGSVVVFTSTITDPQLGAPGQENILRVPLLAVGDERAPGPTACLTCKSIGSDGQPLAANANGSSRGATVSADGAWVAFESEAKNLLAGTSLPCPQASAEVILRNLLNGQSQRVGSATSPVNCGPAGSGSSKPAIDWHGGKIAFESTQPLVAGDDNGMPDVYAIDLGNRSLLRISDDGSGRPGNAASTAPSISGDGSTVAFVSAATNLDAGSIDRNGKADVHLRAFTGASVRRLSKTVLGDEADSDSQRPDLNYNGTALAFDSDAGNLAPGGSVGQLNVYARDNPGRAELVFSAGFE